MRTVRCKAAAAALACYAAVGILPAAPRVAEAAPRHVAPFSEEHRYYVAVFRRLHGEIDAAGLDSRGRAEALTALEEMRGLAGRPLEPMSLEEREVLCWAEEKLSPFPSAVLIGSPRTGRAPRPAGPAPGSSP